MFSDQTNAPDSGSTSQDSSPLNIDTANRSSALENLSFDANPTALDTLEEKYLNQALNQQQVNGEVPLIGKNSNDQLEGEDTADLIAGGPW